MGFKSAAGHQSPRSPLRNAPLIWWLAEPPRSSSGFTVHNTGGHFDFWPERERRVRETCGPSVSSPNRTRWPAEHPP
jgi:hypothetical protein